ncbi:hypothetical protein FZC35_00420 [Candidatus Cytomitobacter indipagum]|uniref:UDP-N-acetylmuramoyl-tripeptide--D-alanyl-D-alanine ligase n=1 Tax=Candidatus Cytomitobacter indipagum TaxID=2601575 RepID=A0A5C0UDY0_9PROT|nr:Mur ligase family protein [Candidatus Cytomitobacter indipagum]QEK37853.1 hypothetical protein FZC35_00420 [Candidatus Cytomitobacter indipagum]
MKLINNDIMLKTFQIDDSISGISLDSRKKADLFFCIQGNHYDGHDFAQNAIYNGFKYIVASKPVNIPNDHVIYVNNVEEYMIKLTKNVRNQLNSTVIAITGTAGKTSTKEQMKFAFSERKVLASPESYNTIYGLALTICNIQNIPDYLILEAGTSHPGEMEELARIIKPHYSIITSIGAGHIEHFRDIEHIAEEKSQLLQYTSKYAFFPEICEKYCPANLSNQISQQNDDIYEQNAFPIMKIAKMENLINASNNIKNYSPSKGRNNIVKLNKDNINFSMIDGSFNCNPISLQASIKQLMKFPGKKIAVLGEMKELGDYAEQYHHADYDVDHLLLLGDIWKTSKGKIFNYYEELCKYLEGIMEEGAVILLKGSNSTDVKLISKYLEDHYGI